MTAMVKMMVMVKSNVNVTNDRNVRKIIVIVKNDGYGKNGVI